ncbi:hypothetical protein BH23ACT5_BH23ACT5_00200 [soil metagenome]
MPHLFDRVAGLALTMPNPGTMIFPEGWGDPDLVGAFTRLDQPARPAAIDMVWQPKTEHRGYRRRRGSFASPISDLLPDDAHQVPVELTEPAAASERLVVLLPSWNDEGFESRRLFAESLAARRVATLAANIPLYGRRRRRNTSGMPIRTVADFGVMGLGAVIEAEAIVNALSGVYRQIGVGGFSMGGNLAALVSARSILPLATGLMAASHSPGPVYLEGTLRHAISWKALGGREARQRLSDLLEGVSALSLPPRDHHRAAVAVAARSDGFVPASSSAALADHWTGSELRWLPGGHATLWRKHRHALVDAIVDSFDRLEVQRSSSS